MKKIIITISLIAASIMAWSQTNTFPTSGNVGIGTTSPAAKIQVQDATGVSALFGADVNASTLTNATRKFARLGAPHYLAAEEPMAGFVFDSQAGESIIWMGDGTNQFNTATELRFATASTNTNQGSNNLNNVKMTINSSGNVGIGITAPEYLLDIKGSSSNQDLLRLSHPTSPTAAGLIVGFGRNKDLSNDGAIEFKVEFSSVDYSVLGINRHNRDFYYTGDGNVGIGTNNPQSKLSVDGQIRATEVKVLADISVPDYVFEPDYQLRTLQETKEYITQNRHLPEIPSAAEMGENGIDLGDMNMRLLKKIEELTLYQIELLEKLEQQNERISELEKKITEK